MFKPNLFRSLLIVAAVTFGGLTVFSQGAAVPSGPSYEATLFVLVGSDERARSDLPKSLDGVARKLREAYAFKNYRLMSTYYGRLANNGSLEYKGVSSIKYTAESDPPVFINWQLANFNAGPKEAGDDPLSIYRFRFGARVPVVTTGAPVASQGGSRPVVNYESVGMTLDRLSIAENRPTLVGTISLPGTSGTAFLVLAITRS